MKGGKMESLAASFKTGRKYKTQGNSAGVAIFVRQLKDMLSDPACSGLLVWEDKDNHGTITIIDYPRLKSTLFPKYFPRASDKSFTRQLNLHGFRRVPSQGNLVYSHPKFLQVRPDLHSLIHRNKRSTTSACSSKSPPTLKSATAEVEALEQQLVLLSQDQHLQTLATINTAPLKEHSLNICRILHFLSTLRDFDQFEDYPNDAQRIARAVYDLNPKHKLLYLFSDYFTKLSKTMSH